MKRSKPTLLADSVLVLSATGFAQYLDIIRQAIVEGQSQGVFRKELNATVCAKIFYGALDEMATNWILSKRDYQLAPLADTIMDIFFGGILQK